jgi:hypothetical protein
VYDVRIIDYDITAGKRGKALIIIIVGVETWNTTTSTNNNVNNNE